MFLFFFRFEPIYVLKIFLFYQMYFTIIIKYSHQKKLHFKPNKTYREQSQDISPWKWENDPAELDEIRFLL